MTNEQRMGFLMAIYNLVFASKERNTDITKERVPAQWMSFLMPGQAGFGRWYKGNLRGFKLALNLGTPEQPIALPLLLIEQNPFKRNDKGFSSTAILAQQGHKIMWVIQDGADRFFGSIQDGVWKPSEQQAVYSAPAGQTGGTKFNPPVSPGPAQAAQPLPSHTGPLPQVPQDTGIPEYVVSQLGDYTFDDFDDSADFGGFDDSAPWE